MREQPHLLAPDRVRDPVLRVRRPDTRAPGLDLTKSTTSLRPGSPPPGIGSPVRLLERH